MIFGTTLGGGFGAGFGETVEEKALRNGYTPENAKTMAEAWATNKDEVAKWAPTTFLAKVAILQKAQASVHDVIDVQPMVTQALQIFRNDCKPTSKRHASAQKNFCEAMRGDVEKRWTIWKSSRMLRSTGKVTGRVSLEALKGQLKSVLNTFCNLPINKQILSVQRDLGRRICKVDKKIIIAAALAQGIDPVTASATWNLYCTAINQNKCADVISLAPQMLQLALAIDPEFKAQYSAAISQVNQAKAQLDATIPPELRATYEAAVKGDFDAALRLAQDEVAKNLPEVQKLQQQLNAYKQQAEALQRDLARKAVTLTAGDIARMRAQIEALKKIGKDLPDLRAQITALEGQVNVKIQAAEKAVPPAERRRRQREAAAKARAQRPIPKAELLRRVRAGLSGSAFGSAGSSRTVGAVGVGLGLAALGVGLILSRR